MFPLLEDMREGNGAISMGCWTLTGKPSCVRLALPIPSYPTLSYHYRTQPERISL